MQILFAAVTHLDEGLSLETLLTLSVEKSLIIILLLITIIIYRI
jgi:hypothetical protein